MLFNSLTFVAFFAIVVTAYWSIRSWNARKNLLVAASYVFYGAWNPPFAALLFSTTAMDFWLGRQIAKAKGPHSRRAWLVGSVGMNLSMLGFFKYGNFLLQNFQWLLARIGIIYQPPHLDILLPVGISFVVERVILVHWSLRDSNIETAVMRLPRWIVTAVWAFMACAIILTQGNSNAFIYFQF